MIVISRVVDKSPTRKSEVGDKTGKGEVLVIAIVQFKTRAQPERAKLGTRPEKEKVA